MQSDGAGRWAILWFLFAINAMNFYDRQVLAAVTEPIRREWSLSDTQIGQLGTAFILLYAVVGIPLGRLADVWERRRLLVAGVALWSVLTYASGLCRSYWSMFGARLGVGVGEAACAPAATSLIGDLFGPAERARALSIFMLGLPVGLLLSNFVSGAVAERYGWRSAFFVAGTPGLVLALLGLRLRDPKRGSREANAIGDTRRAGSPYRLVLGIPTMWWIIASGALHNFNMYALSGFLPAFLTRYHGVSLTQAGLVAGLITGGAGMAGMLAGGWAGDRLGRRGAQGRLLAATVALAASAPAGFLALAAPRGDVVAFMACQAAASMLMYAYYPTVYSTIQDIVEPGLRGTAMALYFFAMYLLGAALGPVGTGWVSDLAARHAAGLGPGVPVPEAYRAVGLHQAMYVIPALGVALAAVLAAGSATVGRDAARLREWMAAAARR